MDLKHLHLIKSNDSILAYYPSTFDLIAISETSFQVLTALKLNMSIDSIALKYHLETDEIQSMLCSLENSLTKDKVTVKFEEHDTGIVNRITLHVSNDCNLRCKYCYAGGGNYKQAKGMMSLQTAQQFVDFCVEQFEKIGHIVFFGGEPMLNVTIMEFICRTFKEYYKNGTSSFLPKFGIITNGTLLTSDILNFIQNNLAFITVSIDGLKKYNDANRVFANGLGSYDKISRFIHTVLKETTVPIRYEATFTQYHMDHQCKYEDIINALTGEFGIGGEVVDEISIESKKLQEYWNTLDYEDLVKSDYKNLPQGFWNILYSLVYKKPRQMCPVPKKNFAVASDGEIYPCHMNNGEYHNSLGNVGGINIFNTPVILEKHVSCFHLKNNIKCIECWANNICGGCSLKWFYDEKTQLYKEVPNEELCKSIRIHLEHLLLLIIHIRKSPRLWKAFLERTKNMTEDKVVIS